MDLICYMFEAEVRGVLHLGKRNNGVTDPRNDPHVLRALARMTGENQDLLAEWLDELIECNVASVREDGALISRRMLRDQVVRNQSKERMKKMRERNNGVTDPEDSGEHVNVNETVKEVVLKRKEEARKNGDRATRIPEDFVPKEEHYALGKELGIIVDMEFQRFRDYYLGVSGSKGIKRDWNATLRNWLRNSVNYGGGNGKPVVDKQIERIQRNREILNSFHPANRHQPRSGSEHSQQNPDRSGSVVLDGDPSGLFSRSDT